LEFIGVFNSNSSNSENSFRIMSSRKSPAPKSSRPVSWIEIDSKSLEKNIKFLRELFAPSKAGQKSLSPRPLLCAPVKANAYGHGLIEIVRILKKLPVDYLAVHSLDEAISVRKAGWRKPVLAVGYIARDQFAQALKLKLEPNIYSLESFEALEKAAKKAKQVARVHLKIETGTNRQGLSPKELKLLGKKILTTKFVSLVGASTHFANIEDTTDHTFAYDQLSRFNRAVKILNDLGLEIPLRHTACSAAHFVAPETRFEMIRPGIALYGHWPSRETLLSFRHLHPQKIHGALLKPVLSFKTKVAQIKTVEKGETVGYGRTFQTERRTRLAVVPVGYFDGYGRGLSNLGYALINGRRAPIRGRVCMNNTTLDITGLRGIELEDEVTLIGKSGTEEITAELVANWCGTIQYETLARLGQNLSRIVV